MRNLLALASIVLFATAAYAYSTGDWKCVSGACTLGASTTSTVTITTDGTGDAEVALPTGSISTGEILDATILVGDFAAGAVDTTAILDATILAADFSAGAVDTAAILDGTVLAADLDGKLAVVSLASGALTLNTIHLATAAADYDIPDLACDAAGDVGNWVTVVMEDDSTVISITSDDASNAFFVPGLDIAAGNELDSTSTAANEGSHITLTCLAAEGWYATSMSAITGGVIAWADGGAAD